MWSGTVLNVTFMLSTLVKLFSTQHILKHFSQKTGFDISCKLSPLETISMKRQILFSGKNITYLSSAELAQRVVMVKGYKTEEEQDSVIT